MRPELAVMCYGALLPKTAIAVLRHLSQDTKYNWQVQFHEGDAAVDRARSMVATNFYRGNADVLVMIDRDIDWQPGDLTYLADVAHECKGLVGALVSKRAIGQGYGCRLVDGVNHEIASEELVPLTDGAYVGAAMLAVDRECLRRIVEAPGVEPVAQGFWPFFIPDVAIDSKLKAPWYASEDWAFVGRIQRVGCPCYLAMRPLVRHWGEYPYGPLDGWRGGAVRVEVSGG